jgi:hypothetical protein
MSYIDTLTDMKNSIEASVDVPVNHKIEFIKLLEEKQNITKAKEDPFNYFFTDIISRQDIFNFETVLKGTYGTAQEHAGCCIDIFIRFSQLEANISLYQWLSSAIKVVNCIAIHYLQEVLGEQPQKQGYACKERSQYIQINTKGVKAQKAGSVMDNLFEYRNEMEHPIKNDPKSPGKQIFFKPNYRRFKKNIEKTLPKALNSFDDAYKEYYT